MKWFFFTLWFFFSFLVSSQELLLHYNFNGTSNDISGNNYHGDSNGIHYVNDINGNANSAASFDGIDDFISLPNIIELKPSLPVSFSLLVKFDNLSPENSVVFTTDFDNNNHSGVFMTISSTGNLAINYGDARGNTTSFNRRSKLTADTITPGVWYNVIAVVRSANDMDIFFDCVNARGTYSGSGNDLAYTSNPGSIGRKDSSSSRPPYYFKGTLDEFKYYKGDLSPNSSINTIFSNIPSEICIGDSYVLPTVSDNSISGTWSPMIDTSIIGTTTYTFTPDSGQCGEIITRDITINLSVNTLFNNIPIELCQESSYLLPTVSDNLINGNWSPMIDTSILGTTTYTFTPDSGQCGEIITRDITINSSANTLFNNIPTELCQGSSYILPTVSDNLINGNWSPVIDSSIIGTRTYTFTPDLGQCGEVITRNITVTSSLRPIFSNIPSEICLGDSYVLPTASDNSISGTWFPLLDTSIEGNQTYTFTPDPGQCGEIITRNITVESSIIPVFNTIFPVICEGSSFVLPEVSDNFISGSWSRALDTSIITEESYVFTPDAGQCGEIISFRISIRRSSSNPLFTSIPSELCLGTSYSFPTISDNSISGTWSPMIDTSILGTNSYTFIPETGQCSEMITHNLTITEGVNTDFNNIPSELCIGTSYVLPIISDNSIKGSWSPELDTTIKGSAVYTFTPDTDQCGTSVIRTIEIIDFKEIVTPLFFTPNDDGINDYWKVGGLENTQNISVSIFDRYGKLLNNYNTEIGWNGFYNGVKMPPNDYWYLIEGEDSSCKTIKKKGHFSLLRK